MVKRLTLHPFDQIVGRDAAAVETLIDNDALLVCVSGQAAHRVHDALAAVAFYKDVAELATRKLFDALAVFLRPVRTTQTVFTKRRKDCEIGRASCRERVSVSG